MRKVCSTRPPAVPTPRQHVALDESSLPSCLQALGIIPEKSILSRLDQASLTFHTIVALVHVLSSQLTHSPSSSSGLPYISHSRSLSALRPIPGATILSRPHKALRLSSQSYPRACELVSSAALDSRLDPDLFFVRPTSGRTTGRLVPRATDLSRPPQAHAMSLPGCPRACRLVPKDTHHLSPS